MYLIITRAFPPELGGMQNLMWGLSNELSKNFMIKVFADYIEDGTSEIEKLNDILEKLTGSFSQLESKAKILFEEK